MNKHFIINYILSKQLKYPTISETPEEVLSHLLFCNGNGCEVLDGNFVTYFDQGMCVPYSEMYKYINSSKSIIRQNNDRDADYQIEKDFNQQVGFEKQLASIKEEKFCEDTLWDKCHTEFYNRYNDVDLVDNYSLSDLQNKSTYITQILAGEYQPYLGLSPKYYRAFFFNKSTNKDLVIITIALVKAYIEVLSDFLVGDYPRTWKNPCSSMDREDYEKLYTKDIAQLNTLCGKIVLLGQLK